MEDGTREWMDAGAGALCLGLDYQPSANASFEELVRLCRVTAEHGGIYAAHQRYAHLGRPVAWRETIELAKASGCPVHVSHERVDRSRARPWSRWTAREWTCRSSRTSILPA